jgi:hypothetical protein
MTANYSIATKFLFHINKCIDPSASATTFLFPKHFSHDAIGINSAPKA